MSKAKITAKDGYRCAPEGHTVVTIPYGEIVTGKIAEWALQDKAASRMLESRGRPKKNPVEENKNMGSAPENKAVK